ncbi:hypothetical protein [Arthrobacter sp. 754]|uniref:hypothetical protein n=1 Tax=Arthrobacter sp. 754 TaxID=3156315 RepID=UPI00339668E2
MTNPHFEVFLAQSIREDAENEAGLDRDELYGVYTSWCLMNNEEPQAPEDLWAALKEHRIKPADNHLAMKGPAAADYIIASAPDIV